jgi:hypothetical protein
VIADALGLKPERLERVVLNDPRVVASFHDLPDESSAWNDMLRGSRQLALEKAITAFGRICELYET